MDKNNPYARTKTFGNGQPAYGFGEGFGRYLGLLDGESSAPPQAASPVSQSYGSINPMKVLPPSAFGRNDQASASDFNDFLSRLSGGVGTQPVPPSPSPLMPGPADMMDWRSVPYQAGPSRLQAMSSPVMPKDYPESSMARLSAVLRGGRRDGLT